MEKGITLQALRDAARRISGVAAVTPLLDVSYGLRGVVDDRQTRLMVKCETMQAMGAFKIRGAYNYVAQLSDEERRRGLLTYSSGNHGQAVAMAAAVIGVPCVIVMPMQAVKAKVEGVRRFGAEIVFAGTSAAERRECGDALAQSRGLTVVPPFDHESIVTGQGTAGLEILEQCPDVSAVYVPIGGGGMLAGLSAAVKLTNPAVRVIGVEPEGAATMSAAFAAGGPVQLSNMTSIADGLLSERAGEITYAYARKYADEIVTVSEREIGQAVLWLFQRAKLAVEPSSAVTIAAILRDLKSSAIATPLSPGSWAPPAPDRRTIVAVLTGGNVDLEVLCSLPALASSDGASMTRQEQPKESVGGF